METSAVIAWIIVLVLLLIIIGGIAFYAMQPKTLGVKYSPVSENAKTILDIIQNNINASKPQITASITQLISTYQNLPVEDESTSAICQVVTAEMLAADPRIPAAAIKFVVELNKAIVGIVCINGKSDKSKVIQLLTDIRDSLV